MRIDRIAPVAALAAALLLGACDTARPSQEASAATGCTSCHGGADNLTGAPPKDTLGRSTGPMVGAHTRHLEAGVACESCHRVPARVDDPGHIGAGAGKVQFGPAAKLHGANPSYAFDTTPGSIAGGTCSATYCHGGTLTTAGGALRTPTWNGPKATCGDCHGNPPPSHGAVSNCFQCHPDTVKADNTIKPGGKHVDGTVQWDAVKACTICHGDASRVTADPVLKAAPPRDVSGAVSSPQVGAHQAHLQDGALAKAFACAECHVVPTTVAHATDGGPVVVFNGPIGTTGATPTYANGTCSSVYCHGGGNTPLPGGTNQAPSWAGGPDQAACGTCHAFLPPAPHPQLDIAGAPIAGTPQCSQCHPGTVNANGTLFVQNGLHVNGRVDTAVHGAGWVAAAGQPQPHGLAANYHDPAWPTGLASCRTCHGADLNGVSAAISCNGCHAANGQPGWQTSCTFCHGTANRASFPAAPPVDTQGRTAATDRGVGAHQTHLLGKQPTGAISLGVACADCHGDALPTDLGHVNGTTLLALRQPGTATALGAFDGAAGTCSSTYCHGGFRNGNATNVPAWTQTSGQSACDACHAPQTTPAGSTDRHALHVLTLGFRCGACHLDGYDPAATPPSANRAKHVNGTVDFNGTLTFDRTTHNCTTACHNGGTAPFGPWY